MSVITLSQEPAAIVTSGPVPIPSTSNRPVFNTSTNVLSWSGPVGGGPSNGTYTPQTRTLTASGAITSSAAGQIIEGKRITGSGSISSGVVTINHNNVTLRQCSIMESTVDKTDKVTVFVAAGVTGTVIEDCEIDGNAVNGLGGTGCISGTNFGCANITARRNNCHRSEQAIRYVLNNISFTENWCHQIGGSDADWIEVYPVGGTCDHLLLQYNTLDGTNNAQLGADAGVNLTTGSGLPTGNIGPNISIDSNWFINWSQAHCVNFDRSSGGVLSFSFTNNGILAGYEQNIGIDPGVTCSPNSGNYVMATPSSTTGTPLNGTGKL